MVQIIKGKNIIKKGMVQIIKGKNIIKKGMVQIIRNKDNKERIDADNKK